MPYDTDKKTIKERTKSHFHIDLEKGLTFLSQRLHAFVLLFFILIVFSLSLTQRVQAETIISNTATANFSINGITQHLSDSALFTKDAIIPDPLILQKRANKSTVNIGDVITYTLTISNPNDQALNTINIQDTLPEGLSYNRGSATFNGNTLNNNAVSNTANTLIFTLGRLPAKTTWSVSYQLEVAANATAGKAINQAIVKSDTVGSNAAQATVEINDPIINENIVISKQGNRQSANINDEIRYTITIQNQTERELKNLVAKDLLPNGFVYLPGSTLVRGQQLAANNINVNDRSLQFSLGSLAINQVISFSYRVIVTENAAFGDAINEVQASSDSATSDKATAIVKVRTPSIIEFFKIEATGINSFIPGTSFNTNPSATVERLTKSTFAQTDQVKKINEEDWQSIKAITLLKGTSISLPTTQPLVEAQIYTVLDPIIIRLTDLDQNVDATVQETVVVTITIAETNDKEILRLTEISPNTGVFRGAIQGTIRSAETFNGNLSLIDGAKINVNYRDSEDNTDTSATAALVLPPTTAQPIPLALNKTVNKSTASLGELVRYTLSFKNSTNLLLPTLTLQDTLPPGFRYLAGSATLNGTKLQKEVSTNGRSLVFNLRNMSKDANWTVEYVTKISAGTQPGKSVNKAQLITGQNHSNIARATVTIKDDLMRTRNILSGRVYIGCEKEEKKEKDKNEEKNNTKDSHPAVLKNARIYLETGRSILSDREGYWHMEGIQPGSHVLQLDSDSLPEGYKPLLCQDNTRHAGDAKSKFVDLQPGSLWQVDFHVQKSATSSLKGSVTQTETNSSLNDSSLNKAIDPFQLYDKSYLESADPSFAILWPKHNYVPATASTKIMVKSSPKHKVELYLNDKKVNPLNYDGSDTNTHKTVILRRWKGVDINIKNRDNRLLAVLKDKSGKEIARKSINIHFSGEPASAELLADQSVLVADGKTTPVIAFLIKDEDGFPIRANTHGYYTLLNRNYQPKILDEDKTKTGARERERERNRDRDRDRDRLNLNESLAGNYKYTIGEGGIARIQLNPTTQSGEVRLNLQFNRTASNRGFINSSATNKSALVNNNKLVSVWLKPHLREWILVGIAEGTLAHQTLSGNIQTLQDQDKGERFYKRGRIAFFAKGRIKGQYLLTLSYDTHKQKQAVGSQLNGNIDPDAWYTVYADNSNSQYNTPSSRKLYVKIEKESFYALFGDYSTNMTVTELARYERVLNGIKSEVSKEYKGKRYSLNSFISETSNQHQRREIPGDGTSGLYHLSRDIVANSETVRIETRDRFHTDQIIERRELIRYQDYDIDYQAGTLFFKFPITERDQNFNPNIIVVDYDNEDPDDHKSITAGGRVAVESFNGKLETGLSLINKGRNRGRDDRLIATDITYDITTGTKLRIEAAQSQTEEGSYLTKHAYMAKLEREIEDLEARVYFKKQDGNFSIDSQASESGTRKAGAEIRYKLDTKTSLNAEVSHQKNTDNNNERQLAEVRIQHRFKQAEISAGARHTRENFTGSQQIDNQRNNNTLLLGGRVTTKNGRVTLRSNIEKNISSNNSELSPDRLIVGVDVNLKQGFTVFAEHETTQNSIQRTYNSRAGINKQLWQGADIKTTATQERTDQGQRNYATLGLSQKFKVTDKIRGDFSIDRAKTMSDSRKADPADTQDNRFNPDEPALQGAQRDDYTAYTVGFGSNDEDWSWTTRFELRDGEINNKRNITAGLIRYLSDGKNLSATFKYNHSERDLGSFENFTKLSLGSAWHPKNKNFAFLNRLDLVDEDSHVDGSNSLSGQDNQTKKIIHNFHYNQKVNTSTQFSVHHGIKHINENNKAATHNATIDTATLEIRRDITKKWDIGAHGGYLRDWNNDNVEAVAGVSVGVTPVENAWVSLGYNFEGFYDKDFDKGDYKRKGAYVNFRYKFNQDSFKRMNKDGELAIPRNAPNRLQQNPQNHARQAYQSSTRTKERQYESLLSAWKTGITNTKASQKN